MSEQLSHEQIVANLEGCPGWHRRGNAIEQTFDCEDFEGSMKFVNAVAGEANAANHHPDIAISWNTVKLTLTSHDIGGLSSRDFSLARKISGLAPDKG